MAIASTAERLQTATRREAAIRLRLEGRTFAEIGAELGISSVAAFGLVKRTMDDLNRRTTEQAEEWRRLQLDRLEQAHKALWPGVLAGDPKAVALVAEIVDKESKLLGLYQEETPASTGV